MPFHSLQTVSLSSLVHDALVALGLGSALLAGLVFFSLGLLLPGLLTCLGGHYGNPREEYQEFGPAAAPLISEPAPRWTASPEVVFGRQSVARPSQRTLVAADAVL